jgi:2-hydroxycyclohexanecarboxyl-CoA dehydrogenase
MKGLKDKVVIITGGAGGIGRATSLAFAESHAKVAIFDLNEEAAKAVVTEITSAGGDAIHVKVDLTQESSVNSAVEEVKSKYGAIDVLVNNAGWDIFTPFMKSEETFWRKLIDINLMSVLNMAKAVLPTMIEQGKGRVVNIASDAARVGSSGESVYAACKAGVVAFSKTLAREHAMDGVTFNVVCPGVTDTAMLDNFMKAAGDPEKLRKAFARAVPMGRLGKPDDLPGAIKFFASDEAEFITGQVLSVSGGLTMNG